MGEIIGGMGQIAGGAMAVREGAEMRNEYKMQAQTARVQAKVDKAERETELRSVLGQQAAWFGKAGISPDSPSAIAMRQADTRKTLLNHKIGKMNELGQVRSIKQAGKSAYMRGLSQGIASTSQGVGNVAGGVAKIAASGG